MDFTQIVISQHIIKDRANRVSQINANGGLGEAMSWLESRQEEHIVHVMTNTNVILVIDKYTKTCLTLYIANEKQIHVFRKYGHSF